MKPIHVVCVLNEEANNNMRLLTDIRDYCESNRMIFGLRWFNSEKYEKDRLCIEETPSFHIYFGREYFITINISNNPLGYLKYLKDTCNSDEKARQYIRDAWLGIVKKVQSKNINSMFH